MNIRANVFYNEYNEHKFKIVFNCFSKREIIFLIVNIDNNYKKTILNCFRV